MEITAALFDSWCIRRNSRRLFIACVLILFSVSHAAPFRHLFENKLVCDTNEVFCFRGSMTYYSNPRIMHLRARVQKAPGPGMLRIRLSGANELGHRRIAPFEVRVRGHNSEIINHRMIPDHPDVHNWVIEQVQFLAVTDTGSGQEIVE